MDESTECFKVTMFFPWEDNEGNVWRGHSDQNRWIMAVVRSNEEVDKLRDFVRVAGRRFKQDTMYFEWHAVRFELVK